MMKPATLVKFGAAAASCVAVLAFAGASQATMIDLGPFSAPGTVSVTGINYKADEYLTFKFKIDDPLSFDFTATGYGGTFPAPYTITESGNHGKIRVVFDEPYAGSIDYTLTTYLSAVPEPAAWAMMIFGFGVVGGVARRRARIMQPA